MLLVDCWGRKTPLTAISCVQNSRMIRKCARSGSNRHYWRGTCHSILWEQRSPCLENNFQFPFEVFPFFSLCISEGENFGLVLGSQMARFVTRRVSLYDGLADPESSAFPSGVPADDRRTIANAWSAMSRRHCIERLRFVSLVLSSLG